jgi:hypothetical protein
VRDVSIRADAARDAIGRARQGRSPPAIYGVREAFGFSWASTF